MGRLLLTDVEKATLAEIAHRLPRQALEEAANAMKPDTILGWYRKLVARKFDGSKSRCYPGRPRIDGIIEELVVRMARENSSWGFDRIVGAMANLGYRLSDQTVGNILRRNDIQPVPKRRNSTTWADFTRAHMSVLAGETSLRRALRDYLVHYHTERNHQGKDNVLLFPAATDALSQGGSLVGCKERLGGLLKHYHREAA